MNDPKNGDLRVWWIPQVPGKPFYQAVTSLVEAKLLLNALAEYDTFQFENRIKPDYCNAGGLQVYEAELESLDGQDGWCDWYDENGDDIDCHTLASLREDAVAGSN